MKRPNFRAALVSTLLLGTAFLPSRAEDPATPAVTPPHDFNFGIELNPAASENARNFFFESGMNCVRLTGGGFPWSLEGHKKIADDFQKRGLNVYTQLGSHYPDGSYLSLTDAWMVDQDGKPGIADKKAWAMNYGGENWPQYSYTSDSFKKRLVGDLTSYVGHFSDNHNVAGVILHNEAGFFWQTKHLYDYNPTMIAAFHKWLEQQDGAIAVLNSRWGTTYTSFDDVKPPGLPPESNMASWMDWRHFNLEAVADFMKWEADFFHTLRPDVPRTTNLDGQLNNWYGYKLANMLRYSEPMDRVGVDIYPATWTTRTFIPYCTDMVQGVAQGREGNVLECGAFLPGEWKGCDEDQRGGFLRSEVWTMVGHGMSTILIWGFDTFNDPSDPFNARVLACRDVAHQTAMIGVKDFHRPKSRVALCADPDSYLYYNGTDKTPFDQASGLDHEYQGFHAALADTGIQTDVIFAAQLNTEVWKNYDVIVMPSALMMDEATAEQLKKFVSAGGTLIAAAPFASMDRWAKEQTTVPAFGLDDLFGCTVTKGGAGGSISMTKGTLQAWQPVALTPHGASVIGTFPDGSPAVTSNTFEKGRAILFAGRMGQPYLEGASPDSLSTVLADLLKQAAVTPILQATGNGTPIDVSSLVDSRGNLLVVPSLSTNNGKGPDPVKDAKLTYLGPDPGSFHGAFIFPPTATDSGTVRSGPTPVTFTTDTSDQTISFPLGELKSVLPVLMLKDGGPLLATSAPQSVAKGQEEDVTVTCFNPSSKVLQGSLAVRAAGSVTLDTGGPAQVEVPPYDQKVIILRAKVHAPDVVARTPLTAVLTSSGDLGKQTQGVPIDITIR